MSDRMKQLLVAFGLYLSAAGLAGCTSGGGSADDPKRRLTDYISMSFGVRGIEDREPLLNFLTGEAKRRLSAWSEDQFREAFLDSKRQFIKLSISDIKNLSPTEVNITYELSYVDQSKGHD